MDPLLIVYAVAAATNIALAILIYLHAPARPANKLFALFALAVGGWTAGIAITLHLLDNTFTVSPHSSPIFFARATFAAACLSVYFLLAFLRTFPSPPRSSSKRILLSLGAAAAFLGFVSFTPLLVLDVFSRNDELHVSYGPLYPLFALFILICIAHSFYIVVQKLRTSRGIERLQTRYLLLGLILPVVLAAITNLIIPLFVRTSRTSRYGPIFSFIMVGLIAHLIIRYRFMDIRVFVRRGVTYVLAVAVTVALFLLLIASTDALTQLHRSRSIYIELFFVLLIALLFNRLKTSIQRWTDRYLYRETPDYPHVLRDATSRMAALLDLPHLLSHLSQVITAATAAEFVAVYIWDGNSAFEKLSQHPSGSTFLASSIHKDTALPLTLIRTRQPISLEEVLASSASSAVVDSLEQFPAALAIPMFADSDLIAILAIGPKRSGDPYFSEDIDLLSILASQASIAIKNAQLYRQVLQANNYIENILTTMESGVIAVTADGHVTLFNRAAALMANLASDRSHGRTIDSLPPSLRGQLSATLADGRGRVNVESTLVSSDSRAIPIVSSTTAFPHANSTSLGAVIVFTDLTRLKALEAEKRRAERLASLGALASGIAHEIKNPLVAIRTFAELLPDRFSDVEFRDTFANVAIREIQRIDELIARLRDLAPPSTHNFAPLILRHPIEETLELLHAHLEQKRLRVDRVFPSQDPLVMGDFVQLKQLFLNLFLNAIEAMDPDGQLTVSLSVRAAAMTVRSEAMVHISDTGVGIAPAVLEKMFDPFVTTKPGGSGLGLAVCRGIADGHRASIKIENNLHTNGVTVTLGFPLIPQTAPLLAR
jgi:signal transduction histidine kinase